MSLALKAAEQAASHGEIPVGAVLVTPDGRIAAICGNRTRNFKDPTAHAEMLAIRKGCKENGSERLVGYDLYVSLEPCAMCAAAISLSRIRRLYFGAFDTKMGGVENGARVFNQVTCHHAPEIYGGIRESEAAALLKSFFLLHR
ncbi:MAG: nucleoside deaminase [Hyphomicrobiaceae bacterium]|nr:nucleoside deaminase [Hyphomicrobiaceae bacterium]